MAGLNVCQDSQLDSQFEVCKQRKVRDWRVKTISNYCPSLNKMQICKNGHLTGTWFVTHNHLGSRPWKLCGKGKHVKKILCRSMDEPSVYHGLISTTRLLLPVGPHRTLIGLNHCGSGKNNKLGKMDSHVAVISQISQGYKHWYPEVNIIYTMD